MYKPIKSLPTKGHLLLCLGLTLSLVVACASGPVSPPSGIASLDGYISAKMAEQKITGLGLSLVDGEQSILEKGYGLADKARNIAVDEHTIFNLGSVSKLFTGTGIMKLVEAGKIDLDKPLTAYIPEFQIKARDSSIDAITIRSMLTHHSGLPSDYFNSFDPSDASESDYELEFRKLVDYIREVYVASPPNTVFSYSNLAYTILGLVIERVSGKDFGVFMRDEVFGPLGMSESSFLLSDSLAPQYAKGYLDDRELPMPRLRDIPAGGLMSSAHDLSLFMKAMLAAYNGKGGFMKKETLREMLRVQNADVALDFGFTIGLSWWLSEAPTMPGLMLAGHGGDLPPFHAYLAISPEKGIAAAVIVNSSSGGSTELEAIVTQALRNLIELKEGRDPYRVIQKATSVVTLPEKLGKALEGYYYGNLGMVELRYEHGRLNASSGGKTIDIDYLSDSTLALKPKLWGIFPIDTPGLDSLRLAPVEYSGRYWLALRVDGAPTGLVMSRIDAVPIPAAWKARVGAYKVLNQRQGIPDLFLRIDESGFLMCAWGPGTASSGTPLMPISDSEVVSYGIGRSMGETIWVDSSGPSERLRFSGLTLEKR